MSQLKDKIEAWLQAEQKDFFEGIQLLSQVTRNRNLIFVLSKKQNARNLDKINYELSKYLGTAYAPLPKVAPVKPEATAAQTETAKPDPDLVALASRYIDGGDVSESETAPFTELPAEADLLRLQKRALYNRRNEVSQWLTEKAEEGEPTSEVQAKIKEALDIDEEIKALDAQIQHFLATGMEFTPPAVPEPKPDADPSKDLGDKLADLDRKIKNVKSNVSKAKSQAEMHPANPTKQNNYARWKAEYDELLAQRQALKTLANT